MAALLPLAPIEFTLSGIHCIVLNWHRDVRCDHVVHNVVLSSWWNVVKGRNMYGNLSQQSFKHWIEQTICSQYIEMRTSHTVICHGRMLLKTEWSHTNANSLTTPHICTCVCVCVSANVWVWQIFNVMRVLRYMDVFVYVWRYSNISKRCSPLVKSPSWMLFKL